MTIQLNDLILYFELIIFLWRYYYMKNGNIYLKSGSVLLLIFIIGVITLPLIKIIGLGGYIILGVILFIDLLISIVLIMLGIK